MFSPAAIERPAAGSGPGPAGRPASTASRKRRQHALLRSAEVAHRLPSQNATFRPLNLNPSCGQLGLQGSSMAAPTPLVQGAKSGRRPLGPSCNPRIGQPAESVAAHTAAAVAGPPPPGSRPPRASPGGRSTARSGPRLSAIPRSGCQFGSRSPGRAAVIQIRKLQRVPRECQAQLRRLRPLPQPARNHAVAAQVRLDAPAAPPRQQEDAALRQGFLHQSHGRPAEAGAAACSDPPPASGRTRPAPDRGNSTAAATGSPRSA